MIVRWISSGRSPERGLAGVQLERRPMNEYGTAAGTLLGRTLSRRVTSDPLRKPVLPGGAILARPTTERACPAIGSARDRRQDHPRMQRRGLREARP